jgi:hypothetical protein
VTLSGSETPVSSAASGAGVSLAGAPLTAAAAAEDLVTADEGTLSAWLSSSSSSTQATPAIVLSAADATSNETHDGTHADEPSIFVDVDGSACGFSGAETSGQPLCVSSSSSLLDGAWHQLALSWGPGGESLYVDGAFAAAATRSSSVAFTAHAIAIGGSLDGSRGFTGLVDEARISQTVLDEHALSLEYQCIANPLGTAPARRFVEAFHLAGVVTFVVDGNAATPDVTLTPSASSPLPSELVANEPVTLVAMAAMPSTVLAQLTSALGVSFAGADFDQASEHATVSVVTSSASGLVDLAAPIVLHDVERVDSSPATQPAALALAIFAGAPSTPARNLGATNSAGPIPTDATTGAVQLFAVASQSATSSTSPATLSAGGDALTSLTTSDGVALDVIALDADALVTQATVSLSGGSEGAWAGDGLGP